MLNPIESILQYESGNLRVLKTERWLLHLALTHERIVNLERICSMEDRKQNYVLAYVKRSLVILDNLTGEDSQKRFVEKALQWAEVAKAGLPNTRGMWAKAGINLAVHNEGSAQIYEVEAEEQDDKTRRIVKTLIVTHGLIGQYLRGEVLLTESGALCSLVSDGLLPKEELAQILCMLNRCIIGAVSEPLWVQAANEVQEAIDLLVSSDFSKQFGIQERLRRLRTTSIANGEDFESAFSGLHSNRRAFDAIDHVLSTVQLWYVEAALYDFSFEQYVKILLMAAFSVRETPVRHLSFGPLMESVYYQRGGKKCVNIYKKRIIENYLSNLTIEGILSGQWANSPHVQQRVTTNDTGDTAFFSFRFSDAGAALIDFCVEAEKSDVLYEKAVLMLFDLFGLRRDRYDRFNEEERYLAMMNNSTVEYKSVILDYIKGQKVLDIGPGGGALMDLIEDKLPQCSVMGVDISQNVIEELKKKKRLEHKHWEVIYGDALDLSKYVENGSVDTVIFCSILHELFSYIPYNGKKFNPDTMAAALTSAYKILQPGGRIIIRDGIMTEPEQTRRIIRFHSEEGMAFLRRYAADFMGRKIIFEQIGRNKVVMNVNDAMEFLYTYTWGEESYVHEVQEQFGYFTPSGYRQFIQQTLGSGARIVEFRHYLQDGYPVALSQKVEFSDESGCPVQLPDSTCLIVIEKIIKEG